MYNDHDYGAQTERHLCTVFFYIFHDRIGTEAILHSSIYSKYHFRTLEFTDQLEGTTGEAVQYSNRVN